MANNVSSIQKKVDEIIKQVLEEQNKRVYTEEELKPHKYSKEEIKQYLLKELEELKETKATPIEIDEYKKTISSNIELLYSMNIGELNDYLKNNTQKKLERVKAKNNQIIQEACIEREMIIKGYTGNAKESQKNKRRYELKEGIVVYDNDLLQSMEIILRQQEQQMPENRRMLINQSKIIPSEQILEEVYQEKNQLVSQGPNLHFKK